MSDRKAFSLINILRNIVSIYFDTFFAIYFFNLTNYEILPIAKYYLVIYLVIVLSFWLIRRSIHLSYKVYYYRIGISLMALYLALIMLLKENIASYIYVVAIIKGLSEGFYYYPRNVLNSTKITNDERKHYEGIINAINQVSSILIPLLLGIFLTYYTYIQIGKAVFVLMIVIFFLSFYVNEDKDDDKKRIKSWEFYQMIKEDKGVRNALLVQFLRGFTITSGVLTAVITIYKILYFESNLYIGILNSVLGLLTCITCLVYAKNKNESLFKKVSILTMIFISLCIIWLALKPSNIGFIIYLVIYAIGITVISLKSDNITVNASNLDVVKHHKSEYHLLLETVLGISRVSGYVLLLIVGLIGNSDLLKYLLVFSIIPLVLLVFELNRGYSE